MKRVKLLTFLAFVVFAGSYVMAQPVLESGAKIEFVKEVHDYGTVKNGGDGTCVFEFTNSGTEPLILANVKGSCQCTVPEWPKTPIPPGGKEKIIVKYNTRNAGPISKTVTITSNAVNEPTKVLRIKGTVLPPENGTPVNETGAPARH